MMTFLPAWELMLSAHRKAKRVLAELKKTISSFHFFDALGIASLHESVGKTLTRWKAVVL